MTVNNIKPNRVKNKQIKLILFACFLLLISTKSLAEEKSIKWNVKLSNTYQENGFRNFRSEVNYIVFPCFELGGYVGYTMYYNNKRNSNTAFLHYGSPNREDFLHVGIQTSFHPLTFFFKDLKTKPRIDFWIGLKIGQSILYETFLPGDYYYIEIITDASGNSIYNQIDYSRDKKEICSDNFWEGGIGAGLAYYLKFGLGFYVEYSYGQYSTTLNYRHDYRWGVSYTF